MISRDKVVKAFEKKGPSFQEYIEERNAQQRAWDRHITAFLKYDYAEMIDHIAELTEQIEDEWIGALPTPELDLADGLCLPFTEHWLNHREARQWALEILHGRPVLAVDGSQITPVKDYAVPVGAVQVGWFINYHRADRQYEKDIDFEILAPQDLVAEGGSVNDSELLFADRLVNQERFLRECDKLCELMERHQDLPDIEKPLCFFDGSFIVSFAGQMSDERGAPYVQSMQKLLRISKKTRVPLIGYVDNPYSRDIVTLMGYLLMSQSDAVPGTDASLLSRELPTDRWGVRSPLFICARADALTREDKKRAARGQGRAGFYKDVAFTYMRLAQDQPPARIEVPLWLYEEGRADEILDLVRAECIVGTGYPYAIETADALAVISQQDRQRFYSIYQQLADENDWPSLTYSKKANSKRVRR